MSKPVIFSTLQHILQVLMPKLGLQVFLIELTNLSKCDFNPSAVFVMPSLPPTPGLLLFFRSHFKSRLIHLMEDEILVQRNRINP